MTPLTTQLITFFLDNRTEELTTEDIATKFSAPERGIHTQLGDALQAGQLRRRRDADGIWHYMAGPDIGKGQTPPSTAMATNTSTDPLQGLDLAALELVSDVPMPSNRASTLVLDCLALLQRMQPGQATPLLPAAIRATMGKAITAQHKVAPSRFALRRVGPAQVRVWRTE